MEKIMASICGVDPLTGAEVVGDDSAIEYLKQRFELATQDPNSYYNRVVKPASDMPRFRPS
jgi:hypothetical protein